MRIAFGIVSSTEPPDVIAQLTRALGSKHPIFIHHDHRRSAPLSTTQANVHILDNPEVTGWGTWGFVQGIMRTIKAAIAHDDFDYYQLLSATCLPIKPIASFEDHLSRSEHDVNMGLLSLDANQDAMMSHGFRVFARRNTLRARVLSRACVWYFTQESTRYEQGGLGLLRVASDARVNSTLKASLALKIMRYARRGAGGFDHPFRGQDAPFVGSTWFGANRRACEYLLARPQTGEMERFFSQASLCDESYFQSVFGNSPLRLGPSNHLISEFHDHHPRPFDLSDMDVIRRSPQYFARKFAPRTDDAVRQQVLDELRQPAAAA